MKRKTLIIGLVLAVMITCMFVDVILAAPSDIQGHWAEEQIIHWTDRNLTAGYPDDTFRPDRNITRAEFIALVNKVMGFITEEEFSYSDVSPSDWFAAEIGKAKAAGYITGYEDGTMRPNNYINREEAAMVLSKLLVLDNSRESELIKEFIDETDISPWSRGAVAAAVENGYMKGYEDKSFHPRRGITRAETITLLNRAVGCLYNEAGKFTCDVIDGNVTITSTNVELYNTIVKGDIYLTAGICSGSVVLDNVTVYGRTLICGGGENSVYIIGDSELYSVFVDKKSGRVRIVAKDNAVVNSLWLASGAVVEEADLAGDGFGDLAIEIPEGAAVELIGNFDNVDINSPGARINLLSGSVAKFCITEAGSGSVLEVSEDAVVKVLEINAGASVTGDGVVETANVNSDDVVMETDVGTSPPAGGGGGGGGGGGSTPPPSDPEFLNGAFSSSGEIRVDEGTVYEEYRLTYEGTEISLEAGNITGVTVVKDGGAATELVPDAEPGLWLDIQEAPGEYVYTVTDKNSQVYKASLTRIGTKDAEAMATGYMAESDGITYVEYILGEIDLSDFETMYQFSPDGAIYEILPDEDEGGSTLWFPITGQVEGIHIIFVKQEGKWYRSEIRHETEKAIVIDTYIYDGHTWVDVDIRGEGYNFEVYAYSPVGNPTEEAVYKYNLIGGKISFIEPVTGYIDARITDIDYFNSAVELNDSSWYGIDENTYVYDMTGYDPVYKDIGRLAVGDGIQYVLSDSPWRTGIIDVIVRSYSAGPEKVMVIDTYYNDGDTWVSVDIRGEVSSYEVYGTSPVADPAADTVYRYDLIDSKISLLEPVTGYIEAEITDIDFINSSIILNDYILRGIDEETYVYDMTGDNPVYADINGLAEGDIVQCVFSDNPLRSRMIDVILKSCSPQSEKLMVIDSYFYDGDIWVTADIRGTVELYEVSSGNPVANQLFEYSMDGAKIVLGVATDPTVTYDVYGEVTDVDTSYNAFEVGDAAWFELDAESYVYDMTDSDPVYVEDIKNLNEGDNVFVIEATDGERNGVADIVLIVDEEDIP